MDAAQRVRSVAESTWTMTAGSSSTTAAVQISRSPAARKAWHGIYDRLSSAKPGLVGKILSRAEAQVMRLACLYAVLDGALEVDAAHLLAAVAVWEYCDASARLVFGNCVADPDVEKLLTALKAAPDGLTRKQISHDVFKRNKKASELAMLLSELLTEGMIYRTLESSGGGRKPRAYHCGTDPKNEVTT